jgi:hypothetical protein
VFNFLGYPWVWGTFLSVFLSIGGWYMGLIENPWFNFLIH